MKEEGVALLILPSLYKLDLANFGHIEERRKSSHLQKSTIDKWVTLCEKGGFLVDEDLSLAIGIATGLSYLAWLDEEYVPEKKGPAEAEVHSQESLLLKKTRGIFAKYTESIDSKIRSEGLDKNLIEYIRQGDILRVFKTLEDVTSEIVSAEEGEALKEFFNNIDTTAFPSERINVIQKIFLESRYPELILGSSALLVLKKRRGK